MSETKTVALVTGAGKRLGKAIAQAMAEDGYAVAAHYNGSAKDAEALAAEIIAAGGAAAAFQADLSDPSAAGPLFAAVTATLGPVGLLVNSASLYDDGPLPELTEEGWRALIDVNLTAPVMLMKAMAAQAAPPEGASVVNLCDVQTSAPSPQFFAYFCAKIGLEGATRLAALELAPRIRVNGIAPGLVLPSWGQSDAEYAARQDTTPLCRGLGPADIVGAVRYLRDARQVTGHVLPVDAGQRLMGFGNASLSV